MEILFVFDTLGLGTSGICAFALKWSVAPIDDRAPTKWVVCRRRKLIHEALAASALKSLHIFQFVLPTCNHGLRYLFYTRKRYLVRLNATEASAAQFGRLHDDRDKEGSGTDHFCRD